MTKVRVRLARRRLLESLFCVMARRRYYVLAAVSLRLILRSMPSVKFRRGRHIYNILMMRKDVFLEDVSSSLGECGEFKIYTAPRVAFKGMAAAFLPRVVDDNFYVTDDPEIERCKKNYRRFLSDLWIVFERLLKIDGVITGNFSYYAEREFATALEERGIPFVALHKENLKSSGRVDFFIDVYRERRGPFTGRRIVVYNEVERKVQIRAGVANAQQISVCGMPRLDRMHRWRRRNAGYRRRGSRRGQVLLLSFTARTGLPRMGRKTCARLGNAGERLDERLEQLNWGTLFRDTHRMFVRFAHEHPDIDVVMKTKPRERDWGPVEEMLGVPADRPGNLRVIHGGDPFDLITGSDVVCGFNTTGLLEAVAAGIPVVLPWFGEVLVPEMQRYTIDLGSTVEYATSAEHLMDRLDHYTTTPAPILEELDAAKMSALDYWCGNNDGLAGRRVCRTMLAEMVDDADALTRAGMDGDNA